MHERRLIERITVGGDREATRDMVVDEAPLVLTARGREVAVIMRTPGHDLELIRGLLHAEGVAAPALRQAEPDVVDADLEESALVRRALTATAACGVCGRAAIADLERRARAVDAEWRLDAAAIASFPVTLRAAQGAFDATGGLHGAALIARPGYAGSRSTASAVRSTIDRGGALIAAREDVGRHNAVDKLVGWGLGAGVRFADHALVLSGRLGYELAQKAVLAGVPFVIAVSAPSTLAIDVCERFRVTACGFVRDGRLNVYSHGWRIVP